MSPRTVVKSVLARLHLLDPARRLLGRSREHGHDLLIRLLKSLPTSAAGAYLVEVGTTRERLEGQGSTVLLADESERLGLRFVTVDMDPANTQQAVEDLALYSSAEAVTAKGEDFLAGFDQPVAAAYLDAFDIDHGRHSEYRIDRYRRFLGTEITDDASHLMHQACAEALIPRMVEGGLIVIDDTWSDRGRFAGKGATAVPLLLRNGFELAGRTRTAVGLRRIGNRPA